MKIFLRFLFLCFFLVSTDQILKFYFSAISICNKNIAWSIPITPGVFYFLWIAICLFIIYLIIFGKNHRQRITLVFILSGAISNMIDRLSHSCVIDFIDLKFWPIFNLADIYITIGVLLIILNIVRNSKSKITNSK